jgi:hypothetical protein
MRLHPLDPAVKCQHCGKAALAFVRTRRGRDLYRCMADIPCKCYTVHSRHDGRVCGFGAALGTGLVTTWVECTGRELAKGK